MYMSGVHIVPSKSKAMRDGLFVGMGWRGGIVRALAEEAKRETTRRETMWRETER